MLALRQRGFTLIEVMITVAIVAILVLIALPNFTAWMQNLQVRNTAESVLNGVQVARTEAVRRNRSVQFSLTGTADWQVRIVQPPALQAGDPDPVQQRSAAEGGKTSIASAYDNTGATATTVTFNGMGWVTGNTDSSASILRIDVTSASGLNAAKGVRALRVIIGPGLGGSIRMCDPADINTTPALPTGDARICPVIPGT